MSSSSQNQLLETFVPVYDMVPEKWPEARQFLVEHLKKISNAINAREICWYLNDNVLSGKQFFPGTSGEFRSIFRVVVDFSPLGIGTTSKPHGVTITASFRLINLYGACSDAMAFTGEPINQPNIDYDATNINITSAAAFDYAQAVMEFIQEP